MTAPGGLGRRPDPRTPEAMALHPLRAHRGLNRTMRRAPYIWDTGLLPLDQKATGMCVGYAWKGWELCWPIRRTTRRSAPTAPAWYRQACLLDEIPDNDNGDPQAGSSTRGGAAAGKALGFLAEYDWTTSVDDILDFLCGVDSLGSFMGGPLVIGINWYSSFDAVPANGLLQLPPSATLRGGHEILVLGADPVAGWVEVLNSWGRHWGMRDSAGKYTGRARFPLDVLARLMSEDGDCAAAREIA